MKKALLLIFTSCIIYGQAIAQHSSGLESGRLFLQNRGQVTDQHKNKRPDIDFKLTADENLHIFVGSAKLHYQWNEEKRSSDLPDCASIINSYRMDVSLIGADSNAKIVCDEESVYFERYYLSEIAHPGETARAFRKITYQNVYPNIDWTLYINKAGKLEYDFIVKAGGKVSDIRIRFNGSSALRINEDGSLTSETPLGSITEKAPYSYQEDGREVKSGFVLNNNILSFSTDSYEGVLTIDPVLEWATYYGGGAGDYGRAVACDANGGVYLTGSASSASNIATTGSHQVTFGGGDNDVYLAKFDSSGTRLWATYYGGSGNDQAWSVKADRKGDIYVVGQTSSSNNIILNGFQNTYGGGTDAFLAKFNTSGILQWATYYGGSANDEGWSVSTDQKGHVYVGGRTYSSNNISTPNTHKQAYDNGGDAFLVKFDSAGNRIWGTYYGGSGVENTWAIDCDRFGNIYMSGETGSEAGITTTGAHQTSMTPSNGSEAFIAKFSETGNLKWGTYYGGNQSGQVFGSGITSDDSGNVFMIGYTTSTVDIATGGSHQPANGGGYDAFLVKFDSVGRRSWGTYYGGDKSENGYGIVCDKQGNVYITGYTNSPQNIATSEAIQSAPAANSSNDFFVAKFKGNGERQWGTYYGASGYDAGWSLAHDNMGNLYVAGFSNGNGLSSTNGFQTSIGGSFDALLFRLSECFIDMPVDIIGPDSICPNVSVTFKTPGVAGADSYIWVLPTGWTGNSTADSIVVTAGTAGGRISVMAANSCDTSDPKFIDIGIFDVEHAIINVNGFELSTSTPYQTYQWFLNGSPIVGANKSKYQVTENGDYYVVVTTDKGCVDTSDTYTVNNANSIKNENEIARQIHVYPNPSENIVTIYAPFKVNIVIKSIDGKVIKEENDASSVSIGEIPNGIYLIRVSDHEGNLIKVEKIIKQN